MAAITTIPHVFTDDTTGIGDTYAIPKRGRYRISVGNGDLADSADAASEDFEDASFTLKLGNTTLTGFSGITAATVQEVALAKGDVLAVSVASTTTACRITLDIALIDPIQGVQ